MRSRHQNRLLAIAAVCACLLGAAGCTREQTADAGGAVQQTGVDAVAEEPAGKGAGNCHQESRTPRTDYQTGALQLSGQPIH